MHMAIALGPEKHLMCRHFTSIYFKHSIICIFVTYWSVVLKTILAMGSFIKKY